MARSFLFNAATIVFVSAFSLPAFAQAVPSAQTGTASPGRVQEQISRPEFQQGTALLPIEVKQGVVQNAPKGSENIRFVLKDIDIEGISVYGDEVVRPLYADMIGKTITLADLYDVAGKITNKFRNDGYILTQVIVPPQTLNKSGSVVKLKVVEGYIDGIHVAMEDGAKPESDSALKLIREIAGRIHTNRALNVRDLERNLLLINDLPGVNARGILAPSATKPAAADLTILVSRKPFDALISADNYGTKYLGPLQLSGAVSANSLFGNNERLTAQAVVAPQPGEPAELGYLALDYMQPLLPNGLKLDATINHTETNPGYRLKPFDVRGHATFYGLSLSYPVIRTRATNIYTTGSFDMRDVNTSNNIELTRRDRIRALRGDLRVEQLDTFFGAGLNTMDLEISQGLDVLGASGEKDLQKSRADGDPVFTKVNLEVQRLQRVADHWNLLLSAHGQLSDSPLLTSEQFSVGGMDYGRGYDPSEIIGDSGFAAKAEVQWNLPGPFSITHDNQLFGFYEGGQVWLRDTPSTRRTETASSAGFGVRSKIGEGMRADATVAIPLNRDVSTIGTQDPRLFISVSQKF